MAASGSRSRRAAPAGPTQPGDKAASRGRSKGDWPSSRMWTLPTDTAKASTPVSATKRAASSGSVMWPTSPPSSPEPSGSALSSASTATPIGCAASTTWRVRRGRLGVGQRGRVQHHRVETGPDAAHDLAERGNFIEDEGGRDAGHLRGGQPGRGQPLQPAAVEPARIHHHAADAQDHRRVFGLGRLCGGLQRVEVPRLEVADRVAAAARTSARS